MKDTRGQGPSKIQLFCQKVKELYQKPSAWVVTCLIAALILAVVLVAVLLPHGGGDTGAGETTTSLSTTSSSITTTRPAPIPQGEPTAAPTEPPTEPTTETTTASPTTTAAPTEAPTQPPTAAPTEPPTQPPTSPSRNAADIAESMIGRPIDELIAVIGQPSLVEHENSCDVPGEQDGYYYFTGFTVVTLSENGVDKIVEIAES